MYSISGVSSGYIYMLVVIGRQRGTSHVLQEYIDEYRKADVSDFRHLLCFQIYRMYNTFIENMPPFDKNR
jgi:hypothetical protein